MYMLHSTKYEIIILVLLFMYRGFTPTGTFSGYFGCVDISVRDLTISTSVFEGDHFINQYLNSPVQRGFSATCLQTVRDTILVQIHHY